MFINTKENADYQPYTKKKCDKETLRKANYFI